MKTKSVRVARYSLQLLLAEYSKNKYVGYTFVDATAEIGDPITNGGTVIVNYTINKFTITASITGGTITAGTGTFDYGTTQAVTFKANSGRRVSTIKVDDVALSGTEKSTAIKNGSIEFASLDADHNVVITTTAITTPPTDPDPDPDPADPADPTDPVPPVVPIIPPVIPTIPTITTVVPPTPVTPAEPGIEIEEADVPLVATIEEPEGEGEEDEPKGIVIDEEEVPLAAPEHACCILHFLIALLALLVEIIYTNRVKKGQADLFEIRREL